MPYYRSTRVRYYHNSSSPTAPSCSESQCKQILIGIFLIGSVALCIGAMLSPIATPRTKFDSDNAPTYRLYHTCCNSCGTIGCSWVGGDYSACQNYDVAATDKVANSTSFAEACPVFMGLTNFGFVASITGLALSVLLVIAFCVRCNYPSISEGEVEKAEEETSNEAANANANNNNNIQTHQLDRRTGEGGDENVTTTAVVMGDMIPPVGYAISREDSNFNNNNNNPLTTSPNKIHAIRSNDVNRHNIITAMEKNDNEKPCCCPSSCSCIETCCPQLTKIGIFYRVVLRACMIINFVLLMGSGIGIVALFHSVIIFWLHSLFRCWLLWCFDCQSDTPLLIE